MAVGHGLCAAIVIFAILVSAALGAPRPGRVNGLNEQLPDLVGHSSPGEFRRAIYNADTLIDGEWLRLTEQGAEAGITGGKMAALAALAAVPGPEKLRAILELVHYCTTPGEAFELLKLAPRISEELANLHRDEQYREQALLEFKFVHPRNFLKWFRSNEQPRWAHLQALRKKALEKETKEVLHLAGSGVCAARGNGRVNECITATGAGTVHVTIESYDGSSQSAVIHKDPTGPKPEACLTGVSPAKVTLTATPDAGYHFSFWDPEGPCPQRSEQGRQPTCSFSVKFPQLGTDDAVFAAN